MNDDLILLAAAAFLLTRKADAPAKPPAQLHSAAVEAKTRRALSPMLSQILQSRPPKSAEMQGPPMPIASTADGGMIFLNPDGSTTTSYPESLPTEGG